MWESRGRLSNDTGLLYLNIIYCNETKKSIKELGEDLNIQIELQNRDTYEIERKSLEEVYDREKEIDGIQYILKEKENGCIVRRELYISVHMKLTDKLKRSMIRLRMYCSSYNLEMGSIEGIDLERLQVKGELDLRKRPEIRRVIKTSKQESSRIKKINLTRYQYNHSKRYIESLDLEELKIDGKIEERGVEKCQR